jgi:hypothetical protein
MNEPGKSDKPVVPAKSPNKAGGAPLATEGMEGRGLAKEKRCQRSRPMGHSAQCRKADLQQELARLRLATFLFANASDPRQEPGAVIPPAGIRAGGGGQPPSLPRQE